VGKCGEFEIYFLLLPLQNYNIQKMSTFIGKYEAKADVKGRIFIPSNYRKLLIEGDKGQIVLRKDAENDCLIVFPEYVWNKMVEDLKTRLDEWNPEDQMLLMQFVSDAEWLDIDSQGRILLSKKNLQAIGVDNSEILFAGMIDRFAVWSKSRYEQSRLTSTDFSKLLKERMMKSQSSKAE